jgi:GNAT superfamily N-acetyltransferase
VSAGATREPARPGRSRRRAPDRGASGLSEATVRAARVDDAAAIADLHVRSWQAAYRGIVPDPILDGFVLDQRRESWARTIGLASAEPSRDGRIWVVEEAGLVVGVATTRPARDDDAGPGTGEVHSIYLAPEAWSRGLGAALLATAVADLRGRGFAPLVLWVIEANARGRRFYERAGWRPDGRRQPIDFDGVLVDEIRYRLP